MSLIETQNLALKYDGRQILKNINIKIERREVFVFIGPTGTGKTTLMRILDLLEPNYSGRLLFNGQDVVSHANRLELRRRMSYVQQRPTLFTMNVYDNIACGLRWRSVSSAEIKARTEQAMEMVGMTAYRQRNARTLSGGEMQRVAIARSLVTKPEILFLDEPTANMDPISTTRIEEVLAHIINERKITIVMATHNMSQGQRLATRLGVLINGEVLQSGSVSDIFNAPENRAVAEFVRVENILDGEVLSKENGLCRIKVGGSLLYAITDLEIGSSVHVLIRPEVITFSLTAEAGSARNVFKCRVDKINTAGSLVRMEVNCDFPLLGVITLQAAQDLNISIGKEIYASFKATAIHVIRRYG